MKKLSISLLAAIISCLSYAQVDTEFWFACPDLSSIHFESCIRLCITTFDQPATVTITQPANPTFATITETIAANSYKNISLSSLLSKVETTPGAIRKTGLLIQSTSQVTAYYANYCDNSEIYSLKGRNALGTDFVIPTQYSYANSDQYGGSSSVEIVATQDGTEVTITPSHACVGYAANKTFTITLNRGESFALRAKSMTALGHLFNTRIKSTKPIAVNYTDDSVEGPGVDLIGDQLVPIELAGQKYVAVRYGGTVEELYFFPTTEDSTHIYANGTLVDYIAGNANVTKAGKAKFTLPTGATYITADNPIIVLQLTSNGTEPGSAILPPIECTGSDEIAYKFTQSSGASLSIVTKTEYIDGFTVNGQAYLMPKEYFTPVPAAPEWSYTYKPAPNASQILRVKNSKGIFHMAVIDNPGTTCSLGYFSNFNTIPLGIGSDKQYYLDGNELHLSIQNPDEFTDIEWWGPNGFHSTETSPVITNVTEANAGTYVVTANHKEGCRTSPDTIRVSIYKPRNHYVSVCYGNTDSIEAEGVGPYKWVPSTLPDEKKVPVNTTEDGIYVVESHKLGVNRIGNTSFNNDNCQPGDILWQESVINVTTDVENAISGMFYTPDSLTAPTLYYTINDVRVGEPFTPSSDGTLAEFAWTPNANTVTLKIIAETTSAPNAAVSVNDLSFAPVYAVTDSFFVTVRDSLIPTVVGDQYICSGKAVVSVDGDYDTYLWSNGADTKTTTYNTFGAIWVQVHKDDCHGTGYAEILNPASLSIILDPLPKICHGDDTLTITYQLGSGEVATYDILFDQHAQSVGFTDMRNQIPNGTDFNIGIPANAPADIYNARLAFLDPICQDTSALPIEIALRYNQTIAQRWNDVLGIRNAEYNDGGVSFTAYQWYKNDEPLVGETRSYLYIADGILDTTDIYTCLLTREDGTQLFTCDYSPVFDAKADNPILLGSSNNLAPQEQIQVRNIVSTATATIYNIFGSVITTASLTAENNTLYAPSVAGIYLLRIESKDTNATSTTFKLIVR